jgi:hypothetical protein
MSHKVPRETQRFLKRYGGLTPYGLPKWRLIVSEERLVREAGVWHDWAEGLTKSERGGLDFSPIMPGVMHYERHQNKPLRVVTEMRETQKYPQSSGWILEMWFPASSYGTRDDWYSYVASDGLTPMLGPYPECGDYEFQFGPWPTLPSIDVLQGLISRYSSGIANRKGTVFSRAVEYLQRAEYAKEKEEKRFREEAAAQFNDVLTPMKSSSLAASRWRNDLAKQAGITEHIGIIS